MIDKMEKCGAISVEPGKHEQVALASTMRTFRNPESE